MTDKRITYALDTSVLLTNANCIYSFGSKSDIVLPIKVLEEIDKHKKRQDSVGSNARHFIRILDDLRKKGSLEDGVRIDKGLGILRVMSYACLKEAIFPPDLDIRHPDHTIIATETRIGTSKNTIL